MTESNHKYYLEISHNDMLTLTLSLSAAMGIVIENPIMFEKAVIHITRKYDGNIDYRITIAQCLEKLNAVHEIMQKNGECRD